MEPVEVSSAVDAGGSDVTGNIRISDDVVAVIAGISCTEVEGVAGMSGGLVGDITEILGKKSFSKGVKVEVGEKEAAIDLFVVVDYGAKIPEVAQQVQENVKTAVEVMTGLKVVQVNVHVHGVAFRPGDHDKARIG
ncbi:MAG: Asp23/Gls24 family envelope stress response protein [Firmicutes bacterium]|nr:Asp23/Gls24 family envelope stress response protein [Bacillota bacterium]